jgi:hypothetical protein
VQKDRKKRLVILPHISRRKKKVSLFIVRRRRRQNFFFIFVVQIPELFAKRSTGSAFGLASIGKKTLSNHKPQNSTDRPVGPHLVSI